MVTLEMIKFIALYMGSKITSLKLFMTFKSPRIRLGKVLANSSAHFYLITYQTSKGKYYSGGEWIGMAAHSKHRSKQHDTTLFKASSGLTGCRSKWLFWWLLRKARLRLIPAMSRLPVLLVHASPALA